jgi:hypothetical protein
MKTSVSALLGLLVNILLCISNNTSDSLVLFSDLKFHSDFEKERFQRFINHKTDTFNLFLAIDKNVTGEEAAKYFKTYISIYDALNKSKLETKNINRRIKIVYSAVHDRFLKKYNSSEYFPITFQTGVYNCVSASMLYALVFDRLNIPYKVKVSSNHVYLVANPGPNSIVIETTNPGFEKMIFTGEFKQQYVNYLRESKLISEQDYRSKSVEEIFEEKYNEVEDAEFINLPGIQYYNKALEKLYNSEFDEAYELSQKAYFFYPDQRVKILLYTLLLQKIDSYNYDTVSDIDYIAQLSRFDNIGPEIISNMLINIISYNLQYTDKEQFCDSLFARLIKKIIDEHVRQEVSFAYYMKMSSYYQNTDKLDYYIENALKIKSNYRIANEIFIYNLQRKLDRIKDNKILFDTLQYFKNKYDYEFVVPILREYELIVYLNNAIEALNENKAKTGERYILLFEENCVLPVESRRLIMSIESAYRGLAVYYFYRNNKSRAEQIVERGLKYVPGSRFIKSAIY